MKSHILLIISALAIAGCGASEQTPQFLGNTSSASSTQYVGQIFPDVELAEFKSEKFTQSSTQVRGRVVNLWATWCEPCKREFGLLTSSQQIEKIIAINVNDLSQSDAGLEIANAMIAPSNGNLNVWIDSKNGLKPALPIIGLPITLAINSDGVIVDEQVGELTDYTLARLLKAVDE